MATITLPGGTPALDAGRSCTTPITNAPWGSESWKRDCTLGSTGTVRTPSAVRPDATGVAVAGRASCGGSVAALAGGGAAGSRAAGGGSTLTVAVSGTRRVGATSAGGAAAGVSTEALGAAAWSATADCQSRDNASGGRAEACATTSSTRLSRPTAILTCCPGVIAASAAAISSPLCNWLPLMASSTS